MSRRVDRLLDAGMRVATSDAPIAIAIGIGLCATISLASAIDLPLINPGFEQTSRPLALGEITNGSGGIGVPVGTRPNFFAGPQYANTVEVAGWRTFLPTPQNPTATIRAGAMNPPEFSPGQPFLTGYSGAHVAMSQNAWMQQTLPVFIRPATTYRLTFLAGIGHGGSPEGIYVSLLGATNLQTLVYNSSNGTLLVRTQGVGAPPGSEGQLTPFTLEATTPAVLPPDLLNRFIVVAFVGSDGIPIVNFDDFRLQAIALCGPDLTTGAIQGQAGYGVPNGAVSNDDFFYYLTQFGAGNLAAADMTASAIAGSPGYGVPNGVLNNDDFFYYLSLFAGGC